MTPPESLVAFYKTDDGAVNGGKPQPRDLSRGNSQRLRLPVSYWQSDADSAVPPCISSRENTSQWCICMNEAKRASEQTIFSISARLYSRWVCTDLLNVRLSLVGRIMMSFFRLLEIIGISFGGLLSASSYR
jgi:hypothetical protein